MSGVEGGVAKRPFRPLSRERAPRACPAERRAAFRYAQNLDAVALFYVPRL